MTPSYRHRFLSVPTGTRLDLSWRQYPIPIRRRIRNLFAAAPVEGPRTPTDVDVDAFRAAFNTLADDPVASASAFGALGYTVTTAIHDTAGSRR